MSPPTPPESIGCDRPSVVVRAATAEDAFSIARIYNHHVNLGGATFDTVHWTTDQVARMLELSESEGWFVASHAEGVIGWASVRRYSPRHGYRFTYESAIYLHPTVIGQGIADSLQPHLEAHCRKVGVHHLVAKIIADNERSMAFHIRNGYELVGIQKEVGHMNGKWTDVAILQKILPGD